LRAASWVNQEALFNIAAWAPTLFPEGDWDAQGAWRVPSSALGRPNQEALCIHPSGCKDFGPEWPNHLASVYTAIRLVQAFFRQGKNGELELVTEFDEWGAPKGGSVTHDRAAAVLAEALGFDWYELQKQDAIGFEPVKIEDKRRKLILSDSDFVANFESPEYTLDGILQRRYVYSMTAATGGGKTAVALLLAACIGLGRKLGDREVEQGRVLYFASENTVDVQARWIAMAECMGFDPGSTNVYFVAGATKLSAIADQIIREAKALGDLTLVVVDTSAATFEGEDENNNVHTIEHAKRMRSLTSLPGGPTVLVLCHPTKRAS
jgi:hypothetical protein